MMQNVSFVRKMIYIGCIVLLIIPLSLIAVPSTRTQSNEVQRRGGVLAQLRDENRLSQATLGDVDPTSESMKLGTLGLRPFAVSMLWSQVNEYNKTRNWDRRTATLNQLMKIQPNFLKIWEFQAHNLAFNTSREFDDYEDRYVWVKKGINFLISGIGYFRYDHRMIDNIGYLFSLKVGQSDEKTQFRRLLRKDKDFHDQLSKEIDIDEAQGRGGPDNWLIARQWYLRSENMVENRKLGLRTSGEIIFYLNVPKQRRNYARDYEIEFEPDEEAKIAWKYAHDDWVAFGNRQITSSKGNRIQLRGEDEQNRRITELRKDLDDLVPGGREKLTNEMKSKRTAEEQAAMDAPRGPKQPLEQQTLVMAVELRETIADSEIAKLATSDNKAEAERLVKSIDRHGANVSVIQSYRSLSNYEYWDTRSKSESTETVLQARNALYHARRLQFIQPFSEEKIDEKTGEKIVIPGAVDEFDRSFRFWAEVFQTYPSLEDETFNDDLEEACLTYLMLINGPAAWPQDFPLQYIIDRRAEMQLSDLPTSEQLKLFRRQKPDAERDKKPDETQEKSEVQDAASNDDEKKAAGKDNEAEEPNDAKQGDDNRASAKK